MFMLKEWSRTVIHFHKSTWLLRWHCITQASNANLKTTLVSSLLLAKVFLIFSESNKTGTLFNINKSPIWVNVSVLSQFSPFFVNVCMHFPIYKSVSKILQNNWLHCITEPLKTSFIQILIGNEDSLTLKAIQEVITLKNMSGNSHFQPPAFLITPLLIHRLRGKIWNENDTPISAYCHHSSVEAQNVWWQGGLGLTCESDTLNGELTVTHL